MKATDRSVSKAQHEVWAWKEAVVRDVRGLPTREALRAIMVRAAQLAKENQASARRPSWRRTMTARAVSK